MKLGSNKRDSLEVRKIFYELRSHRKLYGSSLSSPMPSHHVPRRLVGSDATGAQEAYIEAHNYSPEGRLTVHISSQLCGFSDVC